MTELVKFTNDGYRRCPEIGPAGLQCILRKAHSKDAKPVHTDGIAEWGGTQGMVDNRIILDETHIVPVDPESELRAWWLKGAGEEIERTVPKAIEYGSTDLIDIGLMLGRTMGRRINEEEAAELGVFFYLIGKIARWQSAIERGERPSDDTLFDIGVYVRMAQRIRHAGGWPGKETK